MNGPEIHTYGNWRVPRSPGILGLDLASSVLLISTLVVFIISILIVGILAALGFLMLSGATIVFLLKKDRHGVSGGSKLLTRRGYRQARKAGSHQFRSGPLGKVRHGRCQLPGLLSKTALHEFTDAFGRPFALIELPTARHYAIVFAGQPEGGSLVDQDQEDQWVARYGNALTQLGEENGVIGAQVTIETVPDSGRELRQHVFGRLDPNAPELAREVLQQIVATYPVTASVTRAWITLVFASELDGKRVSPAEFAQAVKPRVRGFGELFHSSGVGLVEPLSAQQVCELARIAYDPDAEALLEDEHLAGRDPVLDWQDVGPVAHDTGWDHYRHDSGLSMTWGMTIAPRGSVQSSVLRKLLAPSARVARKRVTLVYRVVEPGEAAMIVDRDTRTAETNLMNARRATPALRHELEKVELTAKEQESGHGLVSFALLVSATVDNRDPDALAIAATTVHNLAATARINLRLLYGSQDSAFAAALPLGVVLPQYLKVHPAIRRAAA
jgi:hypothetical protein